MKNERAPFSALRFAKSLPVHHINKITADGSHFLFDKHCTAGGFKPLSFASSDISPQSHKVFHWVYSDPTTTVIHPMVYLKTVCSIDIIKYLCYYLSMVENSHKTIHPQSKLARVKIGFEYDKTLREIRYNVRQRTHTPNI